jgi:hypothetical protein
MTSYQWSSKTDRVDSILAPFLDVPAGDYAHAHTGRAAVERQTVLLIIIYSCFMWTFINDLFSYA